MRKRHSQKFQYASGGIAVGSDNIFIKENERLNVVFTKKNLPGSLLNSFFPRNSFKESSMNLASGIWEKDAQRFNT